MYSQITLFLSNITQVYFNSLGLKPECRSFDSQWGYWQTGMPRVVFPMGSPISRNTAGWIPSGVTNEPECGGFDSQWGHWRLGGGTRVAVGWGNVLQARISWVRF